MSTTGLSADELRALGDSESFALQLDAADDLAPWRNLFCHPHDDQGRALVYLCGNSLGLQPESARAAVLSELDDWARLAVEGHFHGRHPWYPYHEFVRDAGARLVGAQPHEVVFMNGLTVNLHLLMATFFRPKGRRRRILIEDQAFPSDTYAVRSQLRWHGLDPADDLILAQPRAGEALLRMDDVERLIVSQGEELALVLLPGVSFLTGQVFDVQRITAAAHRAGAVAMFDLAHAAGNIELRLHDWNVDAAVWCTYKYLNSGPGAVAGCFVHERHARDTSLPRFGGWWGNDPATRFRMQLEPEFIPVPSADGWQLSNPPILALAAVRASLEIFDAVGMPALRRKSVRLTDYLIRLLDHSGQTATDRPQFEIVTPRGAAERGSQISLVAHERPRELFQALTAAGVVCDFREPNFIRVAPAPLYNRFHDVWRFARILTGRRPD